MKSITNKLKQFLLPFLLIAFLAVNVSLSIQYRFLSFNSSDFSARLLLFSPLFILISILISVPLQSIKNNVEKKTRILVLLASATLVSIAFLLLPYKFVPFRTVHSLTISVPENASPLTLKSVINSHNDNIDLNEFGVALTDDEILINPGQSISGKFFTTGGFSINLHTTISPSLVLISWDGEVSEHNFGNNVSDLRIQTDPYTWGDPEKRHALLAYLNLFVDWNACVSLLSIFSLLIFVYKKRRNIITTEYLLLNYPLKPVIYFIQLLILFIAIFFFTIKETSPYVTAAALFFSLLIWLFVLLKQFFPRFFPFPFFVALCGIMILGNFLLFPYPSIYPIRIQNRGDKFENLAESYLYDTSTLMSVGFYKQFDGANIIYPSDPEDWMKFNPSRIVQMNQLSTIKAEDYPFKLSQEQFEEIQSNSNTLVFPSISEGKTFWLPSPTDPHPTYKLFVYQNFYVFLPNSYVK